MKIAAKPTAPVTPTQFVPLDNIVNRKELVYRSLDADHIDALAADIAVNGLDTPLLTFSLKPDDLVRIKGATEPIPATYLVAGNHRRAALLKIRRESGDVFKKRFPNGVPVLHRVCSVSDAMCLQLRENIQRKDMSAEEIFPVLEKLTAAPYNMSGKEIAKHVGKSTAWVSQHLAVNEELDPETKSEVASGKITVGAARKIAGEVRSTRKAGGTVTTEAIREKAAAAKAKTASGHQRAAGSDRRVSLKKLYGRFTALTTRMNVSTGRQVQLLTNIIVYSLGATTKLEPEVRTEPLPSKVTPKPATKATVKVAVKVAAKK